MQKKTILIVEDDDRFAKMLSFLFSAKGFNVKTSKNGLEACQSLEENIPAIIILDLVMPIMDGFSLYTKIRDQERLKDIPIIILSGLSIEDVTEKLETYDFNCYLRKPFRTADILALITDAISRLEETSGHFNHCLNREQTFRNEKA
jgi:chemosensory pili system protein ChpA (sensor histidine kinase/response regulator)